MHVHHFVHRYPPAVGGAEAYTERLGRYLARKGFAVHFWTSTALDLEAMWETGHAEVQTRDVRSTGQHGLSGRYYRPLRFLGRRYLLKAASLVPHRRWQCLTRPANPTCPGMWWDAGRHPGPVDAVHAFAFPHTFPAVCGLRLARRHDAPFLLTPFLHLGDPLDTRDRTRRQYTSPPLVWLLRQADAVFAQTPREADAVRRLGVPADRVVFQGLGVDPDDCTGGDREAVRSAWGIAPGERVVGHLANNSVEKGTVDLLHAVGHSSGVRLVLAGPEMPNFCRAWDRCPYRDRVMRLGVLTDDQKRDFFAGLDVFALPSRTDSFGLVLLEAWANGVPVVCYRAGGPGELVQDGTDGRLVACGDLAGLAEAVAQVTPAMGEAGRRRAGTEFQWPDKLGMVRDRLHDFFTRPRPAASPG